MVRKVLVLLCGVMLLTTVGLASPLTDYSQGKVALDIMSLPKLDLEVSDNEGHKADLDGKNSNINAGLTVGLGNKWALQYRYETGDAEDMVSGPFTNKPELTDHQLNVLYKLDKNFSAFVGATRAKLENTGDFGIKSKNNTGYHGGLIGVAPLSDKVNFYGIVSAGNKLEAAEAGFSYALNKNMDINVAYLYRKHKDFEVDDQLDYKADYETKGLGCGLTYRF